MCVEDGVINKLISQQSMPSPSSSCIYIQLLSLYRGVAVLSGEHKSHSMAFFLFLHLRFRLAFCRFVVWVFGVGGIFGGAVKVYEFIGNDRYGPIL